MFFVLAVFITSDAFALRCRNKLVSRGDRKIEVVMKCGEPLLVDKWTETVILHDGEFEQDSDARKPFIKGYSEKRPIKYITAGIEEWTYNFGPNRFIYFIQFRDNRLHRIVEGPRGFTGDIPVKGEMDTCIKGISAGQSKVEVMRLCGEPIEKYRNEDDLSNRLNEEWTYNFGPQGFLYFVTFRHGRVVAIDSGDYGY